MTDEDEVEQEHTFESVLAEDRSRERSVSRRMIFAWIAPLIVILIWWIFEVTVG